MIIIKNITVCQSDHCFAATGNYICKNCTESNVAESVTTFQDITPFLKRGLMCNFSRDDVFCVHKGCHEGYVFLTKKNITLKWSIQ